MDQAIASRSSQLAPGDPAEVPNPVQPLGASRNPKLIALRAAIASGQYAPDPQAIAKKMIEGMKSPG